MRLKFWKAKQEVDSQSKKATNTYLDIKNNIKENAELVFKIVTLSSSAATSLLFGFFVSIGLHFFHLIDKASMLGSLFFYGVILSVLYTPTSILTKAVSTKGTNGKTPKEPSDEIQSKAEKQSSNEGKKQDIPAKLVLAIGIVLLAFSWVMLGYIYSAIFLSAAAIIYLGNKVFKSEWTTRLTWVVLLALFFGLFRGEYLKQRAYDMQITLKEKKVKLPVTVVMTAQSGILAFSGEPRETVLIPWSSIESVQSLNDGMVHNSESPWQKWIAPWERVIDNKVQSWMPF